MPTYKIEGTITTYDTSNSLQALGINDDLDVFLRRLYLSVFKQCIEKRTRPLDAILSAYTEGRLPLPYLFACLFLPMTDLLKAALQVIYNDHKKGIEYTNLDSEVDSLISSLPGRSTENPPSDPTFTKE